MLEITGHISLPSFRKSLFRGSRIVNSNFIDSPKVARVFVEVIAICVVIIAALASTKAQASGFGYCDGFISDNTNITPIMSQDERSRNWKQPCPDEECRARREIVCVADAYQHRLVPNSLAYTRPGEAERVYKRYGRTIQALGREHPGRVPLYCKLLTEVAARITGRDAHRPDNGNRDWTANRLADLAIRLDRPGNHCLADVVAALPQTEAVQADGDVGYMRSCLHTVRACQRSVDPPMR